MSKKILIISPRFPLPDTGACEKDRLEGIKQLKRLGFDVQVVAKVFLFQDRGTIERFSADFGIPIKLLGYENKFSIKRLLNPFYWDGAAYEYSHQSTKKAVEAVLDEWRPDLVWFEYTYLWPLYGMVRKRGIPIITRSMNFEPSHFLQEDGVSLSSLLKFLPKLASELITIFKSNHIFSITPKEEKVYKSLVAGNVSNLPLRGLARCLKLEREIKDKEQLSVFFMGSTYNVHHNRAALEVILKHIAPLVEKKLPGKFKFFILGNKAPLEFDKFFSPSVVYSGYVSNEEFDGFLSDMDIAIVPSLFGAGMQQKIFEPLCRGIPTIASLRGLTGYPFEDSKHLLVAKKLDEFPDLLLDLRDINLRRHLSQNSVALSQQLFSYEAIDSAVLRALNQFT